MARPTKYKEEYAEQAKKLCELGATDAQLADFFEVDEVTINRWKVSQPEFCKSLKLGKEIPNENVKRSLYHSAMGYSHPDVDIRVVNGEIVETPIVKYYPPNPTSLVYYLKNRCRDEFTERAEDRDVIVDPVKVEVRVVDASSNP